VNTYSFSQAAIQDLESICDEIAINNPDAAASLFDDIRKQCVRVARFPLSGKSYDVLKPNLRGFIIRTYGKIEPRCLSIYHTPRQFALWENRQLQPKLGIRVNIQLWTGAGSSSIPAKYTRTGFTIE
jgi:toxin ParE1/3/4